MSVFVCICLHIAAVIVGFFNSVCVCGCVGGLVLFYHLNVCLVFQLSPLIVCVCIYAYLCMGIVIRGPKVETIFGNERRSPWSY